MMHILSLFEEALEVSLSFLLVGCVSTWLDDSETIPVEKSFLVKNGKCDTASVIPSY